MRPSNNLAKVARAWATANLVAFTGLALTGSWPILGFLGLSTYGFLPFLLVERVTAWLGHEFRQPAKIVRLTYAYPMAAYAYFLWPMYGSETLAVPVILVVLGTALILYGFLGRRWHPLLAIVAISPLPLCLAVDREEWRNPTVIAIALSSLTCATALQWLVDRRTPLDREPMRT